MTKKLALVVHGIGEQKAGETMDALVGALTGDVVCSVQSEERLLRETDFDHPSAETERAVGLFPCPVRRVDVGADQVVFAEVYWGDISRGANNRVGGLIDVFRLVMGLGHLVRENAAEIYPDGHWLRRVAKLFVYLLHGPITVLNLVLGMGIGLLFAVNLLLKEGEFSYYTPSVAAVLTAAVMVLIWGIYQKDTQSYLFQVFWHWMLGLAGALSVLVLLTHIFLTGLAPNAQNTVASLFLVEIKQGLPITDNLGAWYTAVLLTAVNATWAICIGLVALLGSVQYFKEKTQQSEAQQSTSKPLFPAICGVMLILWMFLALVLWVTGGWFLNRTFDPADMAQLNQSLEQGIGLIFWIWLAFFALVISALRVWISRVKWVRANQELDGKASIPRLILHDRIRRGVTIGVIILGIGAVWTALNMYIDFMPDFLVRKIEAIRGWFAAQTGVGEMLSGKDNGIVSFVFSAASTVTIIVGALFYWFQDKLSIGIGIVKDVVVYFVRRNKTEVPKEAKGQNRYPSRERVQERFVKVFEVMLASEQPGEVVIISHSQGTIIALEALRDNRLATVLGAGYLVPQLLTMGSPSWHIYGRYFGTKFGLNENTRDGIRDWINIYRVDDFVGTDVQTGIDGWPNNIAVPARGHTGYWLDEEVLPHIRRHVLPEFGK